ncbi:MAG: PorP/SprF family type IX secretion system membrane protein [Saprospiraceae bacterium]|nr:PorP/SprF family type IX secretion system membrane protein [Saprospiraceae bacterium]
MKYILSFCLIGFLTACAVTTVNGQSRYFDERYIYSQHNIYPSLINAGAIGANDYQEFFVSYRNTWAGFEDSPKTTVVGYNGQVGNRLGFGAQLLSDSYGSLNTTKGQVGLSYTISTPTNRVGFGISTEYIQHNLSGSGLTSPQVDKSDPLILERLDGTQYFDASFGIFGLYNNKLTYGLSFPSLISSRISDNGSESDRTIGYIFQLGYRLESSETKISLEPGIVIKSLNNTPSHIDLMAKLGFLEDKLIGGVAYTLGGDKRLGFLLGTAVESLHINYMYNVSSADIQTYNNGSHEISVSFRFGAKKASTAPINAN